MPRAKRWKESEIEDGVGAVHLHSWKYFLDYAYQEMREFEQYVWRGQRCDSWHLESTFDRLVSRLRIKASARAAFRGRHLERFKYAARGRRGTNPPQLLEENDWWALGQHHGLSTPLLDWTSSPFAAAYFAFVGQGQEQTARRAVYALHRPSVEKMAELIRLEAEKAQAETHAEGVRKNPLMQAFPPARIRPEAEFVRPMSDENARLVNQGGLFTRAPDGVDLETWVKAQFKGDKDYVLIKITIPNSDRDNCLQSLNRMNINHLTLFPDLYGASKHCNIAAEIKSY